MNQNRINRVLEGMKERQLTQLFVADWKSIWYLTGYSCEPYERMYKASSTFVFPCPFGPVRITDLLSQSTFSILRFLKSEALRDVNFINFALASRQRYNLFQAPE